MTDTPPRPRRVLALLTEVFANGGIQRFNRTLLTALEALGCDCDVYSLADTEESSARAHPAGARLRIRTFARSKAAFAAATMRAIASGRYDDVVIGHVHFTEMAVSARLFGRRRPRLLLVAHGLEIWDRVHGPRRRALAGIDRFLCVSEYTARSIRTQAPEIPGSRFAIFPNALADLWVAEMGALPAVSAPRGTPFLLAVSRLCRLERLKGVVTALEAFAQLPCPDLRFVIAGDGDDLEFLRRTAARLGVDGRVDFRGAVSDAELVGLYRDCEAFVLPSGQEGFGIVFLEAMFFGAAVIAAGEKGALDVVRDGVTGLLVPYGDVAALSRAIERMLGDRELRERLRSNARATVTGDGPFTAAAFTRRLAGLLVETARPRKVVFVNRFYFPDESATSRMVSDLARRLAASGQLVEVVTSRQLYENASAELPARSEIDGVIVHRLGGSHRGRARLLGRALDYVSFHWHAFRKVRAIANRGDVVVAKTDPPLLSVTLAAATRTRGAHLVNWLQDVFPEVADQLGVPLPQIAARLFHRLRNASLRAAACNVAIGTRMAERLIAEGVPENRICVVPNWADIVEIAPRPRAGNPVRVQHGIDERFVVGYSGNLGRAHEYDTFLEAAHQLRDDPGIAFLITGGGAKLAALRRAVDERGLTNFRFQPHQPSERLVDSMAAADAHLVSLLPALEGLIVPSKYYGILAAARPAIFIGDPDGELAREIRANDTGATVATGDGTALASALRALRDDPGRCAEIGDKARRQAEERHSSEGALRSWLNLLATLPASARAAALPLASPVQSGT